MTHVRYLKALEDMSRHLNTKTGPVVTSQDGCIVNTWAIGLKNEAEVFDSRGIEGRASQSHTGGDILQLNLENLASIKINFGTHNISLTTWYSSPRFAQETAADKTHYATVKFDETNRKLRLIPTAHRKEI